MSKSVENARRKFQFLTGKVRPLGRHMADWVEQALEWVFQCLIGKVRPGAGAKRTNGLTVSIPHRQGKAYGVYAVFGECW